MIRITLFSTAAAGGLLIVSFISLGDAEVSPASRGDMNAVAFNGLQLNGSRFDAVFQGDAGLLVADGGRLRLAAE